MREDQEKQLQEWQDTLREKSAGEVLAWADIQFGTKVKFSSSMGIEDQIIVYFLANNAPDINVFTLDTGRLFQETYTLIQKVEEKYSLRIETFFPDTKEVELMVRRYGINLFFRSVPDRERCCTIRKVKPLQRALSGLDAWICGLRKSQSSDRHAVEVVEWDSANDLFRINPLWNWEEKRLWEYIKKYDIPYNPLHDRNFPSIGCACCTRAIESGEEARDGRWWWEKSQKKECGLHRRSFDH